MRGMPLEPLVNGRVGNAQVRVTGKGGHDAWHTDVAHPAAELGVPPRGHPLVASLGQRVLSEHPPASWRAGVIHGLDVLPPKAS